MQILSGNNTFKLLCKTTNKFGILLSQSWDVNSDQYSFEETAKAVPFLDSFKDAQLFVDGVGIILFDTEAEMRDAFSQVVGDDGPTKNNPYNGPARWYALSCDNNGNLLTENT